MRVYLPSTLTALARAHAAGELPAAAGFAVTPGLRAWCGTEDGEDLEHAALTQAAGASLALLAAEPDAPRRRVVIVAQTPAAAEEGDEDEPGHVRVGAAIPWRDAAAVHVDGSDAEEDVAAAAAGAAERAEPHDLLWFAVQEVPGLLPGR